MRIIILVIIFFGLLLLSCNDSKKGESENNAEYHEVIADVQTEAMIDSDDAADDPAIWINFSEPNRSYVIGTNKQRGLVVYDLNGNTISNIDAGRINNIDLRYHFSLADGSTVDIVAGSNRTNNSISVFSISKDGILQNMASGILQSELDEVYGFCLFHDIKKEKLYAFVNGKSGKVEQWEFVSTENNLIDGKIVRKFSLNSQTEGCVCDDEKQFLYIGEENLGIWKFHASADSDTLGLLIADTSNHKLSPDIEGLTMYYADGGKGYLIASSQGNDTYAIFERNGNNNYLGSFKIVPGEQVDGTSETDGIDVTNYSLGDAFPFGLFIAQDGYNKQGQDTVNQNFKLVSWHRIATSFEPELIVNQNYLIGKN